MLSTITGSPPPKQCKELRALNKNDCVVDNEKKSTARSDTEGMQQVKLKR